MASTSLQYFPSSIKQAHIQPALKRHASKTNALQVMIGEKTSVLSTITISCKSTFSYVEEHPLGQPIISSVTKQKSCSETF